MVMSTLRSVAALATVALAMVHPASAIAGVNSENRLFIEIKQPERDAQTVADIVGDIVDQKGRMIGYARPQDVTALMDLGVDLDVIDMDWEDALQQMRDVGAAPNADGTIKSFASAEAVERASAAGAGFDDDDWYMLYHRYPDFIKKVKGYIYHADPELDAVWVDSIGQTYEGRDLGLAQFGGRKTGYKHWFHIQANLHAREWLAGHSTLYAMRELLRKFGEGDEQARFVLDNVRVSYIPITNPDGYEYSWTFDRFWRKNRRVNADIAGTGIAVNTPGLRLVCPAGSNGVDMNRNFADHFGGGGTSDDPCSDVYRGPFAFSEPVTTALESYLSNLKNDGKDWLGAWDIHTSSALILRPIGWGFIPDNACPDNQAYLNRLGSRMQEEILNTNGYYYESIPSSGLYIAAGVAADWFYSNLTDFRNGMTFELRPGGNDPYNQLLISFAPPPTELIPAGSEFHNAMMFALDDAAQAAVGAVPRRVTDLIYDDIYPGETDYVGDEAQPIFRCEEPRRKRNSVSANAASSSKSSSASSVAVPAAAAVGGVAVLGAAAAALVYRKRQAAKTQQTLDTMAANAQA